MQQPGYGQGAYLGAGHGNGNSYGGNADPSQVAKSKPGYGNGYGAGVQPNYESLGQGVPTADGKSGGAKQTPYNGAPVVPAGLDGMSQFEPQAQFGDMYGGMGGFPFGGQTLGMGAEKSNSKYEKQQALMEL
ncbi:fibroin heavy chain-like [Brachyistius frenatus]|uniref:fibroin heavy chain-like n=1 Tax=Brachyistius frenatus TaxID=100188 RepID=UPI0037E75611